MFVDKLTLNEAVIQLHNIARLVEQELGKCELSKEIREQADKISELANKR